MRKLNYKNIIRFAIMVIALSVVVHDLYMVMFSQFATGYLASWTILGFVTFMFALFISVNMAEKLKLIRKEE